MGTNRFVWAWWILLTSVRVSKQGTAGPVRPLVLTEIDSLLTLNEPQEFDSKEEAIIQIDSFSFCI